MHFLCTASSSAFPLSQRLAAICRGIQSNAGFCMYVNVSLDRPCWLLLPFWYMSTVTWFYCLCLTFIQDFLWSRIDTQWIILDVNLHFYEREDSISPPLHHLTATYFCQTQLLYAPLLTGTYGVKGILAHVPCKPSKMQCACAWMQLLEHRILHYYCNP